MTKLDLKNRLIASSIALGQGLFVVSWLGHTWNRNKWVPLPIVPLLAAATPTCTHSLWQVLFLPKCWCRHASEELLIISVSITQVAALLLRASRSRSSGLCAALQGGHGRCVATTRLTYRLASPCHSLVNNVTSVVLDDMLYIQIPPALFQGSMEEGQNHHTLQAS